MQAVLLANIITSTAKTFGVDGPHFIAQTLSFCLVAFVLHRYAYRPILRVLEERRQQIQESLENAERIKTELAHTEIARKEALAQAGEQANKLIEAARAAAAQVLEQETQKAIKSAQEIIERARQSSETELARMKVELRREVGRLVVETTGKVTGKILTPEDHQRLIEETNQALAA